VKIKSHGAVAQLGERIPRTDEAVGSTPICSTILSIKALSNGRIGMWQTKNNQSFPAGALLTCQPRQSNAGAFLFSVFNKPIPEVKTKIPFDRS
jgi:hypothetical protein